MKENKLFNRPLGWVIFGLLAVSSVFYIYFNFDKANSLITVDIQMDREAALAKAQELATEFEIGPKDFQQAAAFRNDNNFQNFVELEAGGIDTFTQIISEGYYYSYHWSVRHFKEQDANEVTFWFKPNGEPYGFSEKIPESEKGAALNQDEALRVAEHHAVYNWNVDLTPFELIEKSKEEQTSGRVDHTFVYERTDKSIGAGKFRLKLVVCGDRLTTVENYVKIPEDFDRRYSEMRSANETIGTIGTGAMALIYGLFGVILTIFILMRNRRLIWKPAVYWGMGIAFASVFLLTINSLPFYWFSYDTSSSESNFLFRQLLSGLLSAFAMGSLLALSFMAAEGLDKMAFPNHVQWWKLWSKNVAGSKTILGQTIGGYLFAIIILALDVLFYVTTTTHFGWWSPAGPVSDPNILANYLPWLDSIAISLQAGFWEEALFRAVPIAGIYILTKGKKSRNFWIILVLILQTLIFGSGHATYANQPSYARVVEMVIPFTIMGIIYIFYGILPAIIAHYTVDVFWISLPLWVSSTQGIWVDRVLVLLFLFVPLWVILYFRLKNKQWKKIPDEDRNKGWVVPEKEEKQEEVEEETVTIRNIKAEKWALIFGVVGLVAWTLVNSFKADAPIPDVSKKDALEIAKTDIQKKYNTNLNDWTILTSVADRVDIRDIFVFREGGEKIYNNLLNSYLAPPYWEIRFVKTKGSAEEKTEEFNVQVLNKNHVLGFSHKIPEKNAGENLSREEAQKIVDTALLGQFSLKRENLKEISVSPEKQENRTDWEFIYADTTNFPLSQGQGRYLVDLAGNKITKAYSFVYIPEDWIRDYKDATGKKSVIRTVSNILLVGVILLGLVLAIIRWTRKQFNLKLFVILSIIFGALFLLESWLAWPNLMAGYSTQVPMGNFITTALIGLAISGIFFSLFYGIFISATQSWLPVQPNLKRNNIIYALGLGMLVVGGLATIQSISPKTEPFWLNLDFINGKIPTVLLAVSEIQNIIIYPAFATVLFLGIHFYTKSWTKQIWIGILFALLAGLSLAGLSFENYWLWIVSGILYSILIAGVYYFFIRFHFEWIPVAFGIIPVIKMIKHAIIAQNLLFTSGVVLFSVLAVAVLIAWHRVVVNKTSQTG